jgi:hypothetical protein
MVFKHITTLTPTKLIDVYNIITGENIKTNGKDKKMVRDRIRNKLKKELKGIRINVLQDGTIEEATNGQIIIYQRKKHSFPAEYLQNIVLHQLPNTKGAEYEEANTLYGWNSSYWNTRHGKDDTDTDTGTDADTDEEDTDDHVGGYRMLNKNTINNITKIQAKIKTEEQIKAEYRQELENLRKKEKQAWRDYTKETNKLTLRHTNLANALKSRIRKDLFTFFV